MPPRRSTSCVRVVSEPTRARIVDELARESLCTCHLVDLLGTGQTSVSNHLRILRLAGVVDAIPAGRFTYYELRPAAVQALAEHYAGLATSARSVGRRPC